MKCKKRMGSRIKNSIFFVAAALLVFQIVTAAKGNTPSLFGYRVLRVVSSSMQPAIKEDTCILIRRVPAGMIEVGDVITYRSTDPSIYGCYNTHRVFERYRDENGALYFITKGDANDYPDAYEVSEENIVGKYVGELPFGGWLGRGLRYLTDRRTYFAVVILPLVICMISYIIQIMRVFMDEKEDEEE